MSKNKLKVIHVVSSLNVGGAERFVIDLGGKQLSRGNIVSILSFGSHRDTLVNVAKSKGMQVHTIESVASILGQFNLLRLLLKYDIIHIHTAYALKPMSIVMKLIGRKQCVYTRHGAAENNTSEWKAIHCKFKRHLKAMSFVSQEAFDIFRQNYPWHDMPMSVVDNGVLLRDRSIYSKVEENMLNIGSVGRLVPLKHQISLLKAVSLLPQTLQASIKLHIFGDGECESELHLFSKNNLISENINFYGMVSERDKIYPVFDFLVVTSETEGLSLVIMESMAYSKPVIATDVGGNSKLVIDNVNGWLVNYDDHHQLAERIKELFNDHNKIKLFGSSALDYISENFSLDSAADKYNEIYQE